MPAGSLSGPHLAAQLVLALALLAGSLGGAHAAPRAKPAKGDQELANAKALLASQDHDEIEAGIQSLGLLGTPAVVQPLIDRIRTGLPADLLETSIVTLMAVGHASAAPLFFELTAHRRPDVRIRAVEGIAAIKAKGGEEVLQKLLSDSEPKVRSAAAIGLGELKATGSIEVLFRALDKGNFEASQAIGQSIKSDQVPRLLGYLGTAPFNSLAPALREVLFRKDIGERDKLNVVSRLQDVGTVEVKNYFADVLRAAGEIKTPTDKLPLPVLRALNNAMQEIAN